MPRILRRPRALLDLLELWDYITTASNADRADAVLETIERTLQALAEHPYMGRQRPELRPGLRSHPIGRYLVFYYPLADGIDLVRVLYSGRDLGAVFDADDP